MRESKIKESFDRLGLRCWVAEKPIIQTSNKNVFQMTIRGGQGGTREFFGIYCGNPHNEVRVLDTDSKFKQVLLHIKEPRRVFTVKVQKVVSGRGRHRRFEMVDERRETSPTLRKYLMGLDETHYFIAQVPLLGPLNTVKEAHEILRPPQVAYRGKLQESAKRQGEWFFVPATVKENRELRERAKTEWMIARNARIEEGTGRPHIADEMQHMTIKKIRVFFVRGKIKHPDHKTLVLDTWHRVYANRELREISRNASVWGWVD
jgi:hypothetical protein